jgi:hypothetical protein
MSGIGDPALRQALGVFEHALFRHLDRWVTKPALQGPWMIGRTAQRSNQASLAEYQQAIQHWLPVTFAVPNDFLNVVVSTGTSSGACFYEPGALVFNVAGVGISTVTYTSFVAADPDSAALADPDPLASAGPPAAAAVRDIADWFGVSVAEALNASGIRKRTYQAWRKDGTRRPRASSEGRVWELHQLAEDLVETKGLVGLRHWFNEDPERRELLRAGALHKLASQAYAAAKTDTRPAWVGVGNLETYETPRREITLRPMERGDIVEPG